MSGDVRYLALAAVLVGGAVLARRAQAAEGEGELLEAIKVTGRRIGEGLSLDELLDGVTGPLEIPRDTLGLLNHNPMNVRETETRWQGELPHDGDGYEDFESDAAGIRAGAIVLRNYWRIHGLNTVRGIITRWAPPGENPTASYIAFVAAALDVEPDQALDMDSPETIEALATAIIRFEQGKQPFADSFIRDAVQRAFS